MQTEEQKQRGRPGNEATKTVRIELELEREVSLGARKKKFRLHFSVIRIIIIMDI